MPDNRDVWPHAPPHLLEQAGVFMVTGGTYGKLHHFRQPARLDLPEHALLSLYPEYGWEVRAWAVFSNHYHIIAHSPKDRRT
jgi:putative transposase